MNIQSLIFPKDQYDANKARAWAKLNDFKHNKLVETDTSWVLVQEDEEKFSRLKEVVLREEEGVSASSGTLSTDIATPDIAAFKRDDKGKICPDSIHMGLKCFDVESTDYFRAATFREKGARYKINNEKVRAFMKEDGYRSSFLIKYENNYVKVK